MGVRSHQRGVLMLLGGLSFLQTGASRILIPVATSYAGIAGSTRSIDHSEEWSEGSTERYADRDAQWQAMGSNASQSVSELDGKYASVSSLVEERRRVAEDGMFREVLTASLQEMLQLDREEDIYTEERTVGARTVVRRNGPAPALVEEKIQTSGRYLPVVQMHGMGDAATNTGMVSMRKAISERLGGAYVVNVAMGASAVADARNTIFLSMDLEVEAFAMQVRKDYRLAHGFNAIGYSQGNLVIRGYVQRFNDPPVHSFVSMHGPLAGVGGFPNCNLSVALCRTIQRSLGSLAYTASIQSRLAQANYYKDPTRLQQYREGARFLPDLNNERADGHRNDTYAQRFGALKKLVLVKALADTVVLPADSEWFGFFRDDSLDEVDAMEETQAYKENWFGLRTLDALHRIDRLSTPGNHLEFSEEFLFGLVDQYFTIDAVTAWMLVPPSTDDAPNDAIADPAPNQAEWAGPIPVLTSTQLHHLLSSLIRGAHIPTTRAQSWFLHRGPRVDKLRYVMMGVVRALPPVAAEGKYSLTHRSSAAAASSAGGGWTTGSGTLSADSATTTAATTSGGAWRPQPLAGAAPRWGAAPVHTLISELASLPPEPAELLRILWEVAKERKVNYNGER